MQVRRRSADVDAQARSRHASRVRRKECCASAYYRGGPQTDVEQLRRRFYDNFMSVGRPDVDPQPSPCHLRFSTRRRRGSNERPFRLAGDRFHPCDAHLRTRGFPTRELGRCPSDRSGTNIFLSPRPPLPPAKWRTCAPRPRMPLRRRPFAEGFHKKLLASVLQTASD